MSRYRKVDVRLWVDAKFQKLSRPNPSGQFLWLYLLTNPDTVNIPGLYRAGEAGMAEALGWPIKAFRQVVEEAVGQGMLQVDWKARVIWIPRAILYNKPESPNVVTGWKVMLDEIPECKLKDVAQKELRGFLLAYGKAWVEAFDKAIGKIPPNQEQEQEQEQERKPLSTPVDPPPQSEVSKVQNHKTPPEALRTAWNLEAVKLPKCLGLSELRRRKSAARLSERTLEEWAALFRRMNATPFLCGENDRGWKSSFDWIIQSQDNAVKVLEGKYDKAETPDQKARRILKIGQA